MAVASLNTSKTQFGDGYDSIVLRYNFEDVVGGRTIDMTGYARNYIRTGHIIIKSDTGVLKPMPLNFDGTTYDALPANHTYYGIAVNTALTKGSGLMVGICQRGAMNPSVVNDTAGVFGVPARILTAVKPALPLMTFKGDLD